MTKKKTIFEDPRLNALGQRFERELGRELTYAERSMLIDTFYEGTQRGIDTLAKGLSANRKQETV